MSSPKTVMLRMRRVLPSSVEGFKKQLVSEDVAKMKEKIQKAREKLQDKENMDPEDIKKDVSDLQ